MKIVKLAEGGRGGVYKKNNALCVTFLYLKKMNFASRFTVQKARHFALRFYIRKAIHADPNPN